MSKKVWQFQVTCRDPDVLEEFVGVEGVEGFKAVKVDGQWCLEVPRLTSDEPRDEALNRAEKVLIVANNIARVNRIFGADPVEFTQIAYAAVDTFTTQLVVSPPSAKAFAQATDPVFHYPVKELLTYFQDDNLVQEAAWYLNANEYLGVDLYKVWEIIKDDVHTRAWKGLGWVEDEQDIWNFTRSVQFERHWKVDKPPKVRVSNEYAYFFISDIFHRWLIHRREEAEKLKSHPQPQP